MIRKSTVFTGEGGGLIIGSAEYYTIAMITQYPWNVRLEAPEIKPAGAWSSDVRRNRSKIVCPGAACLYFRGLKLKNTDRCPTGPVAGLPSSNQHVMVSETPGFPALQAAQPCKGMSDHPTGPGLPWSWSALVCCWLDPSMQHPAMGIRSLFSGSSAGTDGWTQR